MNDLQNAEAHIRGVESVFECAFAHNRRDVVEFIYCHMLKGLRSDALTKAFIEDCKARYGALPPREQPPQAPRESVQRDNGGETAKVAAPKPTPRKPPPANGVTLNAMFT